MNEKELKELACKLRFTAELIEEYCRIATQNDCNTCSAKNCRYKPWPGEPVRINCPLWEGNK